MTRVREQAHGRPTMHQTGGRTTTMLPLEPRNGRHLWALHEVLDLEKFMAHLHVQDLATKEQGLWQPEYVQEGKLCVSVWYLHKSAESILYCHHQRTRFASGALQRAGLLITDSGIDRDSVVTCTPACVVCCGCTHHLD